MINISLLLEQFFNKLTWRWNYAQARETDMLTLRNLLNYSQFVLCIPTDNVTKFELSLKFGRRQNWARTAKEKLLCKEKEWPGFRGAENNLHIMNCSFFEDRNCLCCLRRTGLLMTTCRSFVNLLTRRMTGLLSAGKCPQHITADMYLRKRRTRVAMSEGLLISVMWIGHYMTTTYDTIGPQGCSCRSNVVVCTCIYFRQPGCFADSFHQICEAVDPKRPCFAPNIVVCLRIRWY